MRLTKAIKNGLSVLAALVEAGSCADVIGMDYEHLDKEEQKNWRDVLKAVEWIRSKQTD